MGYLEVCQMNIQNAEDYYCRIWQYVPHHTVLRIKAYQNDPQVHFWIDFIQPVYIKASMEWKGAGFRLGSQQQKDQLAMLLTGQPFHLCPLREYILYVATVDLDLTTPNDILILAIDMRTYEEKQSE